MLRCVMVSTLSLLCVAGPGLVASPPAAVAPSLPLGPYKANFGKIDSVPGLKKGKPHSAAIVWPTPQNKDEKFPVLSFGHGTGVGGPFPESAITYKTVFEAVVSYGFIIVATNSCPAKECFSAFAHDQIATLKAVKENPGLHPSLATANFSGTGVFGHSMGAMSSIVSAGGGVRKPYKPADYNIKAAVSMHTCVDPGMSAAGVDVPILFTAGSIDKVCKDTWSESCYSKVKRPSKVLFNIKGATHFDPCNEGNASERYAIAYWFACHVKGEHCDYVYGSSGKAICSQLPPGHSLTECNVTGGAATTSIVV